MTYVCKYILVNINTRAHVHNTTFCFKENALKPPFNFELNYFDDSLFLQICVAFVPLLVCLWFAVWNFAYTL